MGSCYVDGGIEAWVVVYVDGGIEAWVVVMLMAE